MTGGEKTSTTLTIIIGGKEERPSKKIKKDSLRRWALPGELHVKQVAQTKMKGGKSIVSSLFLIRTRSTQSVNNSSCGGKKGISHLSYFGTEGARESPRANRRVLPFVCAR